MWREISSWPCSSILLVGACLPSFSGGGVTGPRSVVLQRVVMNMSDVYPSVDIIKSLHTWQLTPSLSTKVYFLVSDRLRRSESVEIEAYVSPVYSILHDY